MDGLLEEAVFEGELREGLLSQSFMDCVAAYCTCLICFFIGARSDFSVERESLASVLE